MFSNKLSRNLFKIYVALCTRRSNAFNKEWYISVMLLKVKNDKDENRENDQGEKVENENIKNNKEEDGENEDNAKNYEEEKAKNKEENIENEEKIVENDKEESIKMEEDNAKNDGEEKICIISVKKWNCVLIMMN